MILRGIIITRFWLLLPLLAQHSCRIPASREKGNPFLRQKVWPANHWHNSYKTNFPELLQSNHLKFGRIENKQEAKHLKRRQRQGSFDE
jgi:hypothetical protein